MKTGRTNPKMNWFCNAVRSVLALALIVSSLAFSADVEAASRRKQGRKSLPSITKNYRKSINPKLADRSVKTVAAVTSVAPSTPAPIATPATTVAKTEEEFLQITPEEFKELSPTTGDDIVGNRQFAIVTAVTEQTTPDVDDSGESCPSDEEVAACMEEAAATSGSDEETCTEVTPPVPDEVMNTYQQCVAEGGDSDSCTELAQEAVSPEMSPGLQIAALLQEEDPDSTSAQDPDQVPSVGDLFQEKEQVKPTGDTGEVPSFNELFPGTDPFQGVDKPDKIPTFDELFPGKKPSEKPPLPKPGEGKVYVCGSAESLKKCIKAGCKNDLRWNNGIPVRQGGQYELGSFDCRTMGSVGAYICTQRGMKSCIVYNDRMNHAMFGVLMVENGKQVWKVVDWGLNVRDWRRGDYAVCNRDGGLFIPIQDDINEAKLPPIVPGFGPKDLPENKPMPKKD